MAGLATVDYADLSWEADGTPRSQQFDDIYFSRAGGLAESTYVYLRGNHIPERWPGHFAEQAAFHVFEAGFGTGLNFLLTLQAFLANQPPRAQLRYVAVERFPLQPQDLQRALASFPELAPLAAQLLAQYPLPLRNWHTLHFAAGQVQLTLIFDDIANALPALQQTDWRFDAWYLDGFAPARNGEMWAEPLWPVVKALARTGSTASTFSAAGVVRRGLQSAGFDVKKVAGFGHKRDMTEARFVAPQYPQTRKREQLPYHASLQRPEEPVFIVGAGIAGAATAYALAMRGISVVVLEQQAETGGTLRQHAAALASPRWSRDHNVRSRFQLAGLLLLKQWAQALQSTDPARPIILQQAILTVLTDADCAREQTLLHELGILPTLADWLDAASASAIAGVPLQHTAVRHHLALSVDPQALCSALLTHPLITVRHGVEVIDFTANEAGVALRLHNGEQEHCAQLVLATGAASMTRLAPLPLRPVRGQNSNLPATTTSSALQLPLRFGGYLTPAQHGRHILGASYDGGEWDPALRLESQQQNIAALAWALPELATAWQHEPVQGDVGHRLVSPDRSPLIGAHPTQDRLWLNLAHGSHALMTACAGAQVLAAQLAGEPMPFPLDWLRAVAPARFRHYLTDDIG
ncbi:FAD-dependent 5-carboxymethylaminomethyl-2-thiouridine(34) oxidoreductase MnmC [Permianibacter sp. IMCC34836]|uniref:FAD-dependent 5-carboxymethylaminomethyl-2-thiouridine(34) oxidoreductase MnmC n=1 Tax=Permianibacter fluminis TaxID=2738515 RepID=UPI00155641EC|nr:FAD-dependent 5-carboxymethylaminomethyl-2-thiouridine(34) oxidoreductase MnmC [Permianibacter fluminis]NQD38147.1 FAD-dependent 5-carboxymethylaminomethyl-2-thiouridine(34) oxidoreductase MnmC [Permianibacter fluminis]